MATRSIGFIGIISIFTLLTVTASAQYSLNVPANSLNTRFYSDVINTKRPALSVSGFNNGGHHNQGYGLKQILEMLYNGSADPMMVDIYNKTVQISGQQIINPFNNPNGTPLDIAGRNSNRLQSRFRSLSQLCAGA